MKKILFCNLDLLVKGFAGWNPEIALTNRNEFLEYISILCEDNNNVVCFISRDKNKLNSGKEHFDKRGYNKFKYKLRDDAREYVMQNRNRNNYFVFIGNKEVDFRLAVNTKSLFIVPTWIPIEEKAAYYGVCVDTPTQLYKFILTLNNKDYIISGNIYGAGYTYTLESQQVLTNYVINDSAKMEVEHLYDIFNK